MIATPAVREPSLLPGFGLTLGFTLFYVSGLVLLPLMALVLKVTSLDWHTFLEVAFSERAVASYRLTFGAAMLAAVINVIFGSIVAWTLVRYDFPARRFVDAIIDLPFALPTAVSGIALTAVFAPNGWLGERLATLGVPVAYTWVGVVVALTLIGLPFVVRSVQPALLEVQQEIEDAAETLGAGRWMVLRRIILPTVMPAVLTGFTMAFARAVGEYGSVIFISGNLPFKTEITALLIVIRLEEFDYAGAAALGLVMLVLSFVLLISVNLLQAWGRRRLSAAGL